MKIIFPLSVFIFSISSFAVTGFMTGYNCSDRQYLQQVLKELNTACAGMQCKAFGFSGTTAEDAIAECVKSGTSKKVCASNVTCPEGVSVCTTLGYTGSTVEKAIQACTKAGMKDKVCATNVICK